MQRRPKRRVGARWGRLRVEPLFASVLQALLIAQLLYTHAVSALQQVLSSLHARNRCAPLRREDRTADSAACTNHCS